MVKAAKRRGVEDLYLCMLEVTLSPTIFVCETLAVDLPSLKTLDLCVVCFQNKDDFMKHLFGCPKLEDLKT